MRSDYSKFIPSKFGIHRDVEHVSHDDGVVITEVLICGHVIQWPWYEWVERSQRLCVQCTDEQVQALTRLYGGPDAKDHK
jgi:hypothetical protein